MKRDYDYERFRCLVLTEREQIALLKGRFSIGSRVIEMPPEDIHFQRGLTRALNKEKS